VFEEGERFWWRLGFHGWWKERAGFGPNTKMMGNITIWESLPNFSPKHTSYKTFQSNSSKTEKINTSLDLK